MNSPKRIKLKSLRAERILLKSKILDSGFPKDLFYESIKKNLSIMLQEHETASSASKSNKNTSCGRCWEKKISTDRESPPKTTTDPLSKITSTTKKILTGKPSTKHKLIKSSTQLFAEKPLLKEEHNKLLLVHSPQIRSDTTRNDESQRKKTILYSKSPIQRRLISQSPLATQKVPYIESQELLCKLLRSKTLCN